MTLTIPVSPNAGLFRPGYQSYDSEDGAVHRNIDACRAITSSVSSALGPLGRNKIIINHLQKLVLTSDAATILRELEVVHPAAKLLVMASQQQETEMGDATNLTLILAGEFLRQAEELMRMGLKTSDIVQGYGQAQNLALKVLEDCTIDKVNDLHNQAELSKALRTVVGSKQNGNEELIADLVAEAVTMVLPKDPSKFNVDGVRVVKIMGGSLSQSKVIKGMVFGREPEGIIKKCLGGKVAVYTCPVDTSQTETKGTVLLHSSKEMLEYTKGEEKQVERIIMEIYNSGIRVVVAGATLGELALHYLNRYEILVIKVLSKFELRRLCRVVGATPLARLGAPMPEERGSIDVVETVEIGGDRVTVFRQEKEDTRTATLVVRGATQNQLDDVERAIDDGVSVIKSITRDEGKLVAGAGASEMQISVHLSAQADRTPGLSQYAIRKFGEAFQIVPRTLADSAGLDFMAVFSGLVTAHSATLDSDGVSNSANKCTVGVDIDIDRISANHKNGSNGLIDAKSAGILDLFAPKRNAIRLAGEVARTILSVDQVIVARQANGPRMPGKNPFWDED